MMRIFSLSKILAAGVWVFVIRGGGDVSAQSSARWLFPLEDGLTINTVDKIFLQWESNYAEAWLNMWCQNGTAGNNVVLGSQLQVDSTGRYGYVIADDFPAQKDFPVACHAQLAVEANGAGTDGPVGITWTSQLARAAKTLSLTSSGSVVSTTSPPAPVSTSATAPVNSPSSSVPVATGSTSSRSTSPSAASSSRETAPPASLSSSSSSTSSSSSPTDTSTSPNATNGATSSTDSKPSASNNVGAIVGGVIGGLALLCFIIFGALFLRKYQRNHDSTTPKRTPSHSWWRRTYRTTEMQTGGLHEKDGDVVLPRLEKDGNQLHEVVGDMPTRHEKEASLIKNRRYTPIELPT